MSLWWAALIHSNSWPQGRVFGVASDHSKSMPAPSWKHLHAGGPGPEGSVHHEARKGVHPVGLLASQASTHYYPLFQKWAAQQWVGAEFEAWQSCDPVTGPDRGSYAEWMSRYSRCFTLKRHLGWHTKETQWSSLPIGGSSAPWEVPTTEQVLPVFLIPASLGQGFSNHGPENHLQENR